jgi:hypothetical protein
MTVFDAAMDKANVQSVLRLTDALIREIGPRWTKGGPKRGGLQKSVYRKLQRKQTLKKYRSKYFPLVS